MRSLRPILLALTAVAVTSLCSVQPAQAFTITPEQVGANVVGTGSGAINLTGLTFTAQAVGGSASVRANVGNIVIGTAVDTNRFTGFTGPTSFGSGGLFSANTASGDFFTFVGSGLIFLPRTYVSNTALSDTMTFNNRTFASMGLTPCTYVWTWGAGPNQNFTLIIGGAGVPDGGTTVSLLGCALLGLAGLRRRLGW